MVAFLMFSVFRTFDISSDKYNDGLSLKMCFTSIFERNILLYMFYDRENKHYDAEFCTFLFALFFQTFQG